MEHSPHDENKEPFLFLITQTLPIYSVNTHQHPPSFRESWLVSNASLHTLQLYCDLSPATSEQMYPYHLFRCTHRCTVNTRANMSMCWSWRTRLDSYVDSSYLIPKQLSIHQRNTLSNSEGHRLFGLRCWYRSNHPNLKLHRNSPSHSATQSCHIRTSIPNSNSSNPAQTIRSQDINDWMKHRGH